MRINGGDKCVKCKMQARLKQHHIALPETSAYEAVRSTSNPSSAQALHRPKLYVDHAADDQSVSSLSR